MVPEVIDELDICFERYGSARHILCALKEENITSLNNVGLINELAEQINEIIEKCTEEHQCGRFYRWLEMNIRSNLPTAAMLKDESLLNSLVSAWFALFFHMITRPKSFCTILNSDQYDKQHNPDLLANGCSKSAVFRANDFYESINEVLLGNENTVKAICREIVRIVEHYKNHLPIIKELLIQLSDVANSNEEITIHYCSAVAILSKLNPEFGIVLFNPFVDAVEKNLMKYKTHLERYVTYTAHLFNENHRQRVGNLLFNWRQKSSKIQKRIIKRTQKIVVPLLRNSHAHGRFDRIEVKNCKLVINSGTEFEDITGEIIDVSGGDYTSPSYARGIHFRSPDWHFETVYESGRIASTYGTSIGISKIKAFRPQSEISNAFENPKITLQFNNDITIPCKTYSVRAYPPTANSPESGAVVFLTNQDIDLLVWKEFVKTNGTAAS